MKRLPVRCVSRWRSTASWRRLRSFGSDLDKASQDSLNRGARMVELLKQGQYQPLAVAKQVLAICAGTKGFLDKVPVSEVLRYERELYTFVDGKPGLWDELDKKCRDKKAFKDLSEQMDKLLKEFGERFSDKPAAQKEGETSPCRR